MAKTKWDELLPSGGSSGRSRNEIVQQLARVTSGGSSGESLNSTGSFSGPKDVVNSLMQGAAANFTEQISSLTSQISNLGSIQQTQIGVTQDNTQAVTLNTSSKSSLGSSVGGTVGGIASTILGGGSFMSPIIGGLMNLFGPGDPDQSTMTTSPFQLPAPVQYEGGVMGKGAGQVTPVNYGDAGQPRVQAPGPAPQVNIQVNTIDSQSFLDHSDEIASAVRAALLSSHSLNDVISAL